MKKKRFISIKNQQGIRKDLVTGRYIARKYVSGKEYSATKSKLIDAIEWRRNFHPLLTNSEIRSRPSIDGLRDGHDVTKIQSRPNGVDQRFTFGEVWNLYRKQHFPLLEPQTRLDREKFAKSFLPELMKFRMVELNPELMDAFMEKKVLDAKELNNPRRKHFDNDLKCLKAMLNWYRENYDGLFVIPILKRHYTLGIIRKEVRRNSKKMTVEEVQLFFESFDCQFWRDFAEFHFYMAGRCQEPAGLQVENLFADHLKVEDVAVWGEDKKFLRLKETPKNGEERSVYYNNRMKEILRRRFKERSKVPCEFFRESTGERLNFVFEIDGQPLAYRTIQYQYNKALKKAGLYSRFKSTHILRKAMANLVRSKLGLDAAQAAGGWKSRDVVEKIYTDAPNELSRQAVDLAERLVVNARRPVAGGSFLQLNCEDSDV
ncbi:MAG: hypothetical protein CMJ16_06470 [Peredibacter sp.]|nr:hypothetical protein [Peredibacter sp.]